VADEYSARSPALNEGVFKNAADLAEGSGAKTMSLGGTVRACLVLLAILVATGTLGWSKVYIYPDGTADLSAWWIYGPLIAGFLIAVLTILRPNFAPSTAPLYAALQGAFLGIVTHALESAFEGIALQAVLLTLGVFLIMLFLYATKRVAATDNFRLGVISATGAVALVYCVDLILRAFGHAVPFINDASPAGIAVSFIIVVIAALNLVLDFDFIEQGVEERAPAYMNWYAAFGLLVTLIWLYLEILRLLAKIRSR
jgi:uncharacterized YccA/Bax inhibitor family protein